MLPWIISAGFFLTAVGLFIKIRMMQKGTDEIRKIFGECLLEDTNAQITVSSGDRELKEAVTNISYDLRTPLTAIIGYLDLLEEEEKSEAVIS